MLRTLRSCGVSARMLNTVLVIEQVTLAIVAGLAGLVCGYFIAAALLPDVAASLRGLYGAPIPGHLVLKREWWIAGIGISVLGALGASAASLIKAIRLPVLASAQPQAWQQAQARWLTWQGVAALLVFALAGLLIWFGDSLLAGFAVLAALLLGAALLLPNLLEHALQVRRARRATTACAVVLGRQPPATVGPVAGADGAVAGARGQCRRRHHGGEFQPHLHHLARRAARRRCLCRRQGRPAGDRDQELAARAAGGAGDPARRPRRYAICRRAARSAGIARPSDLQRELAAAASGAAGRGCGCGPAIPRW